MKEISKIHGAIYGYFHGNASCQKYFHDQAHEEEFVAYYNSMYLLQDSTESLWSHRETGFSSRPLQAYIEFWGVMQAVIIQQEAIKEIYAIMVGQPLDPNSMKAWPEIRSVRNVCAGHPVKKDRPKAAPFTRSFMGRSFGGYAEIMYEQWQPEVGTTYPRVKLGALLDEYEVEAAARLGEVFLAMKKRWP
ncbi:MAG: hypothetical protein NT096_05780 [Proteobacteria bacterium]|nr:hypothetical protein [Pseudomonadota bacterium]